MVDARDVKKILDDRGFKRSLLNGYRVGFDDGFLEGVGRALKVIKDEYINGSYLATIIANKLLEDIE